MNIYDDVVISVPLEESVLHGPLAMAYVVGAYLMFDGDACCLGDISLADML